MREWHSHYMKPLWMKKHEMELERITAEYESEMEFTKNMPPELLKIHIESKYHK